MDLQLDKNKRLTSCTDRATQPATLTSCVQQRVTHRGAVARHATVEALQSVGSGDGGDDGSGASKVKHYWLCHAWHNNLSCRARSLATELID